MNGKQSAGSANVFMPTDMQHGLINANVRRYREHGLSTNRAYHENSGNASPSQRALDIAVIDFLEFRRDVLNMGGVLVGTRVEIGKYTNANYPAELCPNEGDPHPLSTNTLFIEIDRPDGGKPNFIMSHVHHLVKTGLVGHSQEVFTNLLRQPDGYKYDTADQWLERIGHEVARINVALDFSKKIVDPVQKKETQRYLKRLRGRFGETVFIMGADPKIATPPIMVQEVQHGATQNLWVSVGENKAFRLERNDQGPSGQSMDDLLHGGAALLVMSHASESDKTAA